MLFTVLRLTPSFAAIARCESPPASINRPISRTTAVGSMAMFLQDNLMAYSN
jgi:hypothetical protein